MKNKCYRSYDNVTIHPDDSINGINLPDDKSVLSSSLMTASDGKENVNVIIRPDDNIIVIIERGNNLKCYDPACDNTN